MSTSVEKRVLDMQLKNSEFERNAKQTISTINELKTALNFTGAGKGLDDIQNTANSVKFDRLISSVEQIESKFSVLNTAVRNIFSDMVSKAVSAGSQILQAFTIEPITSGFNEYESKLGAIQTILANTASRQKEVSQEAIRSINDEATAAVAQSKELQEQQIDNLQESQAAQDRALSKQFEAQNKAFEKQAQAQTKAFDKQASQRLEAFEKETEQEIDALEKSYDQKEKLLEQQEEAALEVQEKNYEEKKKALEKSQKEETKVLEASYKEQTKAFEKEMKNQLRALEDKFDAETDALEDAIDEQLDALEEQQEAEMDALEEANEAELEAIKEKYDAEIDAAEKAADAELDVLEQKYEDQMDALEESTDEQMDALEDYYDDAYEALEKSQEAETELLKKNHDAKLDMYEEEYMAKLKVADEDRYNKIKAIDDQIDSIKNLEKAEKKERQAAEDRQKLQELTAAVNSAETATERIRAEQKLADFQKKLAEQQADEARDRQIEALESQKAAVNEEYDLRKQNLKEEYESKKANENDLYNTQKNNLDDLHKEQKENLKDEEESAKKELQKQIAEQKEVIKERYEYEKELANENKKAQTQAIKDQAEEEEKALKKQQKASKEALKKQQENQKEALKKQTDAQKKALKEQQQLEKEALDEQLQAQKEGLAETYQIQKEALEERQKQQKEGLKDQNEAEQKAIKEVFDARKEKLDEQKTAELTAVEEQRKKQKEALEEKIEAERTALQDRIDAERTAMKDSQDEQKAALDSRQKAELKAMKARHKQELANIESEKQARIAALNQQAGKTEASSLEDVTKALDELNEYADKTIYSFEDMTYNIGTFTAAGVGLDDSVKAIKGIANLAALSGSNSQKASTAMYQLSQAIANGSLKLEDWNSVVTAGMGGAQFREALKETARAHGIEVDKMIAKEGSFRGSLQHGWLTSEVLLETLSKFTGDLTDEQLKAMGYTEDQIADIQKMAKTAVDAATKVRTWSQLIDTTKEALGSGWAETFEIIFGNFDEATELWTGVSEAISDVIDKQADARNQLLTGWKDAGGRKDLIDAVKNVFNGVQQILKPVQEAFANIFPPITVKNLVDFTKKLKDATSKLTLSDEASKKLKQTFKGLFSGVKIVAQGFGAFFKALSPVWDIIKKVASKVLDFTADLGKLVTKVSKAADELGLFNKASTAIKTALEKLFGAVGTALSPILTKVEDFRKKIVKAFTDAIDNAGKLELPFEEVGKIFDAVKTKAGEVYDAVKQWVSSKFDNIDTSFLSSFAQSWSDLIFKVKTEYGGILGVIKTFGSKIKEYGSKGVEVLKSLGLNFGDLSDSIGKFASGQFDSLFDFFADLKDKAGSAKDILSNLIQTIKDWVGAHFKAPDFSFIFDFIDTLTGKTVTMEKSQGAINYQQLHEAVFKDADLDAMEANLTKAIDLIKEKIKWMKENLTFDDVYDAIKKVGVAIIGVSTIAMINAFKNIGKSISGFVNSIKGVFKSVSDAIDNVGGVFEEVEKNLKMDRYSKVVKIVLSVAISVRILADAVKTLSDIPAEQLKQSAIAIGGLLAEMAGVMVVLTEFGGNSKINALAVVAFAEAMKIVAGAVEQLGTMDLPSLAKGVFAATVALADLAGSSWLVSKNGFNFSAGAGLIEMASALLIVQKAIKMFASLKIDTLKKGGAAAAAALGALSTAAFAVGKANFKTTTGVGMVAFASALLILQKALQKFGNMNMPEIGRGFAGLVAGLVPLTTAVIAAGKGDKVVAGASALTIASVALLAIAKATEMLGDISLGQIGNDLALFAGVLGTIVIAATATQPVVPGMLALAAAIGAIGIAAAGIGVGVTLFVAAMGTLATVTEASATAVTYGFGLLAKGVLDVIAGLIPEVGDVVVALINTICEVITETTPVVLDTVFTFIDTLLTKLIDEVPSIADQLFLLISEVLDALTIYLPEIVTKVVDLLTNVFAAVIDALKNTDTETMLGAIVGMILIESMMKKMAALSKVGPQAMVGIIEAGIAIVELGAVLAAIGALAQIPGLKWLLGEGTEVLKIVGHAIGEFIGAIIGGILNGISAQLPSIATNLCAFINNLKPFLEGVSAVTKKQKNGVVRLFEIIALMTGATIIDAIGKFFSFGSSYTKLGSQLSDFIKAAEPFINKAKDVKAKALKGVKNIADIILVLTAAKVIDGLTSWFTGGNALSSFGAELEAFGPHLKAYADSISGLDSKAVQASAKAMKILAKAADVVPNTGGKLAELVGDNTLDDWGEDLEAFGPHLKAYAESIQGVDANSVKGSAAAMKILARAAKTVPNTGGKLADIIGDNALDDWGAQLEAFGPHLKQYAADTAGITEDSVKGSANAMKILARAAKTVPNSGGIVATFTGDNTLDSFGAQLEAFGTSLANYADSIKDVNAKKVEASAKASSMLVDMANNVPNSGGILQTFFGEKNLETFGGQLLEYGKAIKKYNKQVQGIGVQAIVASAAAGGSLVALANNLPEDEGFFGKLFGGDKDLGSFGGQLKKFGAAMKEYSDSVSGITDTTGMVTVGSIASRMIDIAVKAQATETKQLKILGGYIADLGDYQADYYDSIDDIDYTKVDSSIAAITAIVNLGPTLETMKSDAFDKFGSSLKKMAEAGIEDFVDAFEDAQEETIKSVKKFISAVTKGITDKEDSVKTAGNTVGAAVPSGLIAGMNSKGKEINDAILLITGAMVTAFSTNLTEDTFKGIGAAATNAIKTGFSSPGKEILASIKTLTNGLVGQFQTGLKESTFKTMGTNINVYLANGLKDTLSKYNIMLAVQTVCSTVKTAFNTNLTYTQMQSYGVVAVNGLIAGLSGGTSAITTACYNLASAAKTKFGSTLSYEAGRSSGVNFVNGIISGIGNGSIHINNTIKTVADSAVQTLNNAWDINSPSRITYESGSFFVEGLVDGISDNEGAVTGSVQDLADAASGAWDGLDDSMNVAFNDGIDLSSTATDSMAEDAEYLSGTYDDLDDTMSQTFGDAVDLSDEASDVIVGNTEEIGENLEANNEALNKNITSTNTFAGALDEATPRLQNFREVVDYTADSMQSFSTFLEQLGEDISEFTRMIGDAKTQLETFKKEVKKSGNQIGTLTKKISNLINKLGPLKTKLSTVTTAFDKMTKAVESAATALSKYDKTYDASAYSKASSGKTSSTSSYSSSSYDEDYVNDLLKQAGYDSNGYLTYGSGSSSSYSSPSTPFTSGQTTDELLDMLESTIDASVTDSMRDQKTDLELDFSKSVEDATKKATKTAKNTKKNNEKKNKSDTTVATTSSLKAAAAAASFSATQTLVDRTNEEMSSNVNKTVAQEMADLNSRLQQTLDARNATPPNNVNVENNNTFNIETVDPEGAANEIGRILNRQAERSKAVWGS